MTEFNYITCCNCGIEFGVPKDYDDKRREDGNGFRCPSGHELSYGEGETAKLRRERNQLKQRIAQKDDEIRDQRERKEAAQRSAIAHKGHLTRVKNRVGKGVCPCCNRNFENLARHMESKHPGYSKSEDKIA